MTAPIPAWGSSYDLPAVLTQAITGDPGWPVAWLRRACGGCGSRKWHLALMEGE
ncbi:MAG TPA: hypothetical protein VFG12_07200 [Rhodopila sp.]|nr:hypothetical protein [Rhodopila sp.]